MNMSTSNVICNCSIIVVLNITLLLCATSSENGLSMLFLQPDLQKCTVTGRGLQLAETGQPAHIEVHLVDTDGDPCTTEQQVTAESRSSLDGSITPTSVAHKTRTHMRFHTSQTHEDGMC